MLLIYIVSVFMAYFVAVGMWDVYGNEIIKWKHKLYKYTIYVLLSSIFIWPFSFIILFIWAVVIISLWFVINVYEMIEDVFKL